MINEKNLINDPVSLKKQFQSEKEPTGPYIYLPMDCGLVPGKIEKLIAGYKKSGYSGIIPFTAGVLRTGVNMGLTGVRRVYYL